MKILFLIHELNAPSHTWARRMIEHLKNNITVIVTTKYDNTEFINIPVINTDEKFKKLGRIRNKISRTINKNSLFSHRVLKQVLQKYKPDILFINFAHLALFYQPVWKSFKGKTFIHAHGGDISWDIRYYNFPFKQIYNREYKTQIKQLSDKSTFITNSKFTYNILISVGINTENVYYKYFGAIVKERNKKKKIELNLLFLGRLIDCKGPDFVIDAYNLACDLGLKAKLTIAGDGPLMTTCQLLKFKSVYKDNIKILGAVNDEEAEKLFENADIFIAHHNKGIITRQEEAFGVSIIDAMSFGIPVITAKSGGISEIVIDAETGFLVNQYDIKTQAERLLLLASDKQLRDTLGQNAQNRIKNKFSPEQEKQQLLKILNR